MLMYGWLKSSAWNVQDAFIEAPVPICTKSWKKPWETDFSCYSWHAVLLQLTCSVATVDMQCLSLSASNEIPESELLKDVIYAFQGIEGKWIKFDTGRDSYRIDSQVKIFPFSAQGPCPWNKLPVGVTHPSAASTFRSCFFKHLST